MSQTQTYTFTGERNLHTTTARNTTTSAEYKFSSTFSKPGLPVTTTVTSPGGNSGVIYWKEHALEVDGVKHVVADIWKKPSEPKSSHSRQWTIGENHWQTKYISSSHSWKVWVVKDNTPAPSPAVEFTPYRPKTFGKDEVGKLQVSVPDQDSVFLILLLVYSHLTELPRSSLMNKLFGMS